MDYNDYNAYDSTYDSTYDAESDYYYQLLELEYLYLLELE